MHSLKSIPTLKSFFLAAITFFAVAFTSAQAQQGALVVPLSPPQPVENDGKIEVLEFFAYGCIHCAHLEPKLEEWVKKLPADVKFKRVPAGRGFEMRGVDNVPLFYTLEAMGLIEKLQQKVFDAINVDNVILGNPATLNKWLEKQGVDPKAYENVQKSFSVQNKIMRAYKQAAEYKVASTPTIVVNGRFAVQQQGTVESLFATIDKLISDARVSNKSAVTANADPAHAAKHKAAAKK